MSKVALSGNASGTGTFTIASPNSNTDRTLSLPDASGTVQVSGNPISGTTASFSGDVTLGTSVLATPTGSAPSYLCRAWVNFNGTGTVAIRASGNVSSITDNGTGQYTVNFTNAMPDTNYAFQGAAASNFGVDPAALFASGTNAGWVAAGSFRFFTFANAGGATDYSIISVSIFR